MDSEARDARRRREAEGLPPFAAGDAISMDEDHHSTGSVRELVVCACQTPTYYEYMIGPPRKGRSNLTLVLGPIPGLHVHYEVRHVDAQGNTSVLYQACLHPEAWTLLRGVRS